MTTDFARGTISRTSSSHFPAISDWFGENPVTFPPGRPRLATSPDFIGSAGPMATIGIREVAFRAASAAVVVTATITSGLSATNSPASSGSFSNLPLAQRCSSTSSLP